MPQNLFKTLAPAIILALGLLAAYVIALALGVETVSFTFLLGFPIVSGFVIMHFKPKGSLKTLTTSTAWLLGVMALALSGSLISGLEGLVCIAMAIAPLLLGTLAGGLLYMMVLRWRDQSRNALKIITFPICFLAFLPAPQMPPNIYAISNTIVIDAPPAVVFSMLKSIPEIAPHEIPTRASHRLGIPKPTAAIWEETQGRAVRHSFWGQDVHFTEIITAIEHNRRIAWDFAFPEGWAADGVEDPHVKVGGRYFNVLSGEYSLEEIGGKTRLSLVTRTSDSSGLGAYAKFWHHFFFEDFHKTILELVKTRTEAKAG